MMRLQKQINKMKKALFVLAMATLLTSCRSDSAEESSSSTSETQTQTTQTAVKFTVLNSQNVLQKDIVIMMFKTKITSGNNLPNIEKQVVSDVNGLANFDLSTYITSNIPTKYYFEAFKKVGNNYTWVSKTHPEIDIKKNTQTTTSIIIN